MSIFRNRNVQLLVLGIITFFSSFVFFTQQAEAKAMSCCRWEHKWNFVSFNTSFNTTWKTEIQKAFDSWNAVKDATAGTDVTPMSFSTLSDNQIYSVNSTDYNWQGYTWITPRIVNGTQYIKKVDITPNIRFTFTVGAVSGQYDIQSLMTHELGHSIGIAHCHEAGETHDPEDYKNAVYQFVANGTTYARTLKSYDIASKQYIYWDY